MPVLPGVAVTLPSNALWPQATPIGHRPRASTHRPQATASATGHSHRRQAQDAPQPHILMPTRHNPATEAATGRFTEECRHHEFFDGWPKTASSSSPSSSSRQRLVTSSSFATAALPSFSLSFIVSHSSLITVVRLCRPPVVFTSSIARHSSVDAVVRHCRPPVFLIVTHRSSLPPSRRRRVLHVLTASFMSSSHPSLRRRRRVLSFVVINPVATSSRGHAARGGTANSRVPAASAGHVASCRSTWRTEAFRPQAMSRPRPRILTLLGEAGSMAAASLATKGVT